MFCACTYCAIKYNAFTNTTNGSIPSKNDFDITILNFMYKVSLGMTLWGLVPLPLTN